MTFSTFAKSGGNYILTDKFGNECSGGGVYLISSKTFETILQKYFE
jgi:hypothetical protein